MLHAGSKWFATVMMMCFFSKAVCSKYDPARDNGYLTSHGKFHFNFLKSEASGDINLPFYDHIRLSDSAVIGQKAVNL